MYEITKHIRTINNTNFVTYGRKIVDYGSEIEVEAGSTGVYGNGGNAKTYIRIIGVRGVTFKVNSIGNNGIEILMEGKGGIPALMIGLRFIRKAIKDIVNGRNY